jgi:hypothetical protein
MDQNGLADVLRPEQTVESSRNVELVTWATRIGGHAVDYADLDIMFDCPIVPAFWDRGIGKAAGLLRRVIKKADLRAKVELQLALDTSQLGRTDNARGLFATAFNAYSSVISNYTQKNPTGLVYAFCNTGEIGKLVYRSAPKGEESSGVSNWLTLAGDSALTDPDSCADARPDGTYASLLEDYSKAALGYSSSGNATTRRLMTGEAQRAAAASVAASDPESMSETGKRLIHLGDVLYQSGSYLEAASAFATAYQKNYDMSVTTKWSESLTRAAPKSPKALIVQNRGIGSAPTLSASDLSDMTIGSGAKW